MFVWFFFCKPKDVVKGNFLGTSCFGGSSNVRVGLSSKSVSIFIANKVGVEFDF